MVPFLLCQANPLRSQRMLVCYASVFKKCQKMCDERDFETSNKLEPGDNSNSAVSPFCTWCTKTVPQYGEVCDNQQITQGCQRHISWNCSIKCMCLQRSVILITQILTDVHTSTLTLALNMNAVFKHLTVQVSEKCIVGKEWQEKCRFLKAVS